MSFHDRLLLATAGPRADFLATPALCDAVRDGADRPLYLAYLAQAYHHVRWTCPLLRLAADRCGPADRPLAAALGHYVAEELGHECWILDDIRALGGNASPDRLPPPNWANRAMVGTVRDAIANTSPYAILGMVHVLEGISSLLAVAGAERTAARLGVTTGSGFSYLMSHGALDVEHVRFFRTLVDDIHVPAAQAAIVETAEVVYRLWGLMFARVAADVAEAGHGA